jgi:hypothetical protein
MDSQGLWIGVQADKIEIAASWDMFVVEQSESYRALIEVSYETLRQG